MLSKKLEDIEWLDFRLPDFTRSAWVSLDAENVWRPRLQAISDAWQHIEWMSVVAGIRKCGVTMLSPTELIDKAAEWAGEGLNVLPIEIQGASTSYSSTSITPTLGMSFVYRVVVGTPLDVIEFKKYWDACDNISIGRMLGYPDCCQTFFHETWIEKKMVDTTLAMALNGRDILKSDLISVQSLPENNIMWRWMGIRLVPHLPCAFDCPQTLVFARQMLNLGLELGYEEEMKWLMEVLDWPVEWTANHGIAEIRTPIMKVSTRTDATARKYSVRRTSNSYPNEGAKGITFPYLNKKLLVSSSKAFRTGIDNPIETHGTWHSWHAEDNGFASLHAMNRAHKPIVRFLESVLNENHTSIADLGCGNGVLLKKICNGRENLVPFGIDFDSKKIEHAAELFGNQKDNFFVGDLTNDGAAINLIKKSDMILLMPGRLLELTAPERGRFLAELSEAKGILVLYAYGDWITRYGDFGGLVTECGLVLHDNNGTVGIGTVMNLATALY
jgi:hypothetical protein